MRDHARCCGAHGLSREAGPPRHPLCACTVSSLNCSHTSRIIVCQALRRMQIEIGSLQLLLSPLFARLPQRLPQLLEAVADALSVDCAAAHYLFRPPIPEINCP